MGLKGNFQHKKQVEIEIITLFKKVSIFNCGKYVKSEFAETLSSIIRIISSCAESKCERVTHSKGKRQTHQERQVQFYTLTRHLSYASM